MALFLTTQVFGSWNAIGLPDLHFTYVAILLLSATLVVMGLFSGLERPPRRQVDLETTFSYQDLTPRPGDRLFDYRLLAALLLLATVTALMVLGAYEGR